MTSRIDEIPAYEILEREVGAATYNLVRLALRRLGCPLRFELPGLRGLEITLDRRHWVVADSRMGDLPVLAWTDFETKDRGLHEPARCRLRTYHSHALTLENTILELIRALLSARLAPDAAPPAENTPEKH